MVEVGQVSYVHDLGYEEVLSGESSKELRFRIPLGDGIRCLFADYPPCCIEVRRKVERGGIGVVWTLKRRGGYKGVRDDERKVLLVLEGDGVRWECFVTLRVEVNWK